MPAILTEFQANHLKLCAPCAFPQSFRTKKLGEIVVFHRAKDADLQLKMNQNVFKCI